MDVCAEIVPEMREFKPGHLTACHLYYDTKAEQQDTSVATV